MGAGAAAAACALGHARAWVHARLRACVSLVGEEALSLIGRADTKLASSLFDRAPTPPPEPGGNPPRSPTMSGAGPAAATTVILASWNRFSR